VSILSSDSGRDIDEVNGAGGVVQAGERRNKILFCVDEIRHQTSPLREINLIFSRSGFAKF